MYDNRDEKLDVLFRKGHVELLLVIYNEKNIYKEKLWRKDILSSSAINNILNNFEKSGLISTKIHGRMKYINTTELGNEISKKILSIRNILI